MKEAANKPALLFRQADFPDCYLGERHSIGNAALVNFNYPVGHGLANRVLAIDQAEPAEGGIECKGRS
jgi:hypothetical protein